MKIQLLVLLLLISSFISCGEDPKEVEPAWTQITTNLTPESRYDMCSFVKEDALYILGGRDTNNNSFNDFWKFDTVTETWQALSLPQGFELEKAGRMNYCLYHAETDNLYLYGKNTKGNPTPAPAFEWFLKDNTIKILATSAQTYSLRGHTLSLNNQSLLIFGGEDASGTENNALRALNVNTSVLKDIPSASQHLPLARSYPTSFIHENKLIIIGGKYLGSTLTDIWEFHLADLTWTKLEVVSKIDGYNPSYYHDTNSQKLFFYGGKESNQYFSNFKTYDIVKKTWLTIDENPKPSKRYAPAIGVIGEKMYLFGGNILNDKKESTSTNTLWKYKL